MSNDINNMQLNVGFPKQSVLSAAIAAAFYHWKKLSKAKRCLGV